MDFKEVERWRAEFPILQSHTYLNSCSLGALSHRGMANLGEFQRLWNTMGASAWYELWLGRIDELRARVAGILSGTREEVALVPSVSAGLSAIASSLDYGTRPRVVISELDFPTVAHQWLARPEVELVVLPSQDGVGIEMDAWKEAIDERTAAVVTSHVFFSTGYVQDIAAISAMARNAGAYTIVDGYHGMGQLEVDPRALGADVYLAGPLKWMLGGPGLAYLWVREERIRDLEPRTVSWFGVEDQFDFDPERLDLRSDAGRFNMGTPAMPTVYTALAGAEIIAEAGPARIERRIAELTDHLLDSCERHGVAACVPSPRHRSGIVMLPDPEAKKTVARLAGDGIIVDSRGSFVRISPHFYNLEPELDLAIEKIVSGR